MMEAPTDRTFSKEADERRLTDARNDKSSAMNSRFESQTVIDEAKAKRQAQWDKVRTAKDPKEAPEEKFDGRCLYDQLKQNRDKKEEDLAQVNKFGNQIRGIDGSEAKFLEQCASSIAQVDRVREAEDRDAINDFRNARINNTVTLADKDNCTLAQKVAPTKEGRLRGQSNLLKGVVKRKSTQNDSESKEKIAKTEGPSSTNKSPFGVNESSIKLSVGISSTFAEVKKDSSNSNANETEDNKMVNPLSSVVTYSDSSDSCSSSDSDIDTSLMTPFIQAPEETETCHK